jgi:hypothetical protein
MLSLLITGVSGQDYVDSDEIYFSDELKAGMEFTWEITRFNFEFNVTENDGLGLDQSTTTTVVESSSSVDETSTVTISETTTETTSYDETSVTVTEDPGPIFPDIKPGTKYTIKLLHDFGELSEEDYWNLYGSDTNEYYESSYSDPDLDEEIFGLDLFISPADVRMSNGTELNFFDYSIEMRERDKLKYPDDYEDDELRNEEYYIDGGIAFQKINFVEGGEKLIVDQRYDVETGILLYINAIQEMDGIKADILISLDHTDGININTRVGNDDLTLDVPLSAIFVYILLLLPIVVNKFGKR